MYEPLCYDGCCVLPNLFLLYVHVSVFKQLLMLNIGSKLWKDIPPPFIKEHNIAFYKI